MNTKTLISGAIAGFAAAFVTDINAWSKSAEGTKFDWKLAAKRWIAGAISGATVAAGINSVQV